MPPEKSAYALARYSRSPDSIRDSIEWVRRHDSARFLESFYFQYGHASIADLGHACMCFEGISELAATEIEEEPLWDGQAKSSRYQDFSKSGFVTPPEFGQQVSIELQRVGIFAVDRQRFIYVLARAFEIAGRGCLVRIGEDEPWRRRGEENVEEVSQIETEHCAEERLAHFADAPGNVFYFGTHEHLLPVFRFAKNPNFFIFTNAETANAAATFGCESSDMIYSLSSFKYSFIAFAAFLPAPIAVTTVAAPVTISPPA